MEIIDKMKRLAPDQFHMLVKMHLSFLLDLNTDDCDCSFIFDNQNQATSSTATTSTPTKSKGLSFVTPRKKVSKGVMEGAPLTLEGVCQVFQIIEYLKRPANLKTEGLFRKHGNLKKQQTLKERLNKGITVDLDSGEFSVHECAATLKTFLSDLSEPLLTDAYYRAHCQVASLTEDEKKVQALQLLFLLIPEANYALLRDLLNFLHVVVANVEHNKMTSLNLATVFSTHIMCPRKLSPDCLQSNHQLFIKAVTFMIEQSPTLFTIPGQVLKDVEMFWQNNTEKQLIGQSKPVYGPTNSPVVNTIYSFVDRQKTKEAQEKSTTETALAELYAQVQAMPESAQKRRLINKLNDANGQGTPSLSSKKRPRLKNLLTPKGGAVKINAGKKEGSYKIGKKFSEDEVAVTPSYKRQDSRGNSSMVTFSDVKASNSAINDEIDASPVLKKPTVVPAKKPLPPPRISSLKKPPLENPGHEDERRQLLDTPRCRKALALSPSASMLDEEMDQIISGQLHPSESMTHFLDGGNDPEKQIENENPNTSTTTPKRQKSITEMPAPALPSQLIVSDNDKYIETDF